jgi:hypothetical protein
VCAEHNVKQDWNPYGLISVFFLHLTDTNVYRFSALGTIITQLSVVPFITVCVYVNIYVFIMHVCSLCKCISVCVDIHMFTCMFVCS